MVGGGTAGTMAAITAAELGASVLLLDKAHVRHSGALAMGMDGVNNAVIPGQATPEDYVAEITRANDGIINQRTVYQTASRGYEMVRRLQQYGVKFAKDAHGDYDVRRVHRSGSYVLPMPEGKDIKKVLYRVLRQHSIRERVRIENRVMPVRVLTAAGRAVGWAVPTRSSGPRSLICSRRCAPQTPGRSRPRCPTPTTGSGCARSAGSSPPERPASWRRRPQTARGRCAWPSLTGWRR